MTPHVPRVCKHCAAPAKSRATMCWRCGRPYALSQFNVVPDYRVPQGTVIINTQPGRLGAGIRAIINSHLGD